MIEKIDMQYFTFVVFENLCFNAEGADPFMYKIETKSPSWNKTHN